MITIEEKKNLVNIAVMGEFTLADFKQFEEQAVHKLQGGNTTNLIFDLRGMLSYTPDVAWEEIKFFSRLAQSRLQQNRRRHRRPMAHLAGVAVTLVRGCGYSGFQRLRSRSGMGKSLDQD